MKVGSLQELIPFRKEDQYGFSDSNKNLIIEQQFDDARPFVEDLAAIKKNGK